MGVNDSRRPTNEGSQTMDDGQWTIDEAQNQEPRVKNRSNVSASSRFSSTPLRTGPVLGSAKNASVELHIAELVLHGFAPADRHRIGAAFERELHRLLAERGVPPMSGADVNVDMLDGGAFELAPHARAETIGAQIAHVVYARLEQ